jgi:hypothetical protein
MCDKLMEFILWGVPLYNFSFPRTLHEINELKYDFIGGSAKGLHPRHSTERRHENDNEIKYDFLGSIARDINPS